MRLLEFTESLFVKYERVTKCTTSTVTLAVLYTHTASVFIKYERVTT
jgi:hypothetical protein